MNSYLMCLLHQIRIFNARHLDVSLKPKAFSIRTLAKRNGDMDLRVLDSVLLACLASDEVERTREAS